MREKESTIMKPAVFVRIIAAVVIVSALAGGLAAVVTAAPRAPFDQANIDHSDTGKAWAVDVSRSLRLSNRPAFQPGETITYFTYLPLLLNKYPDLTIVVDHTTADVTKIPPYWISKAKDAAAGMVTSHGSQLAAHGDAEALDTL
jgi:hypothetical protein